MTLRRAVLAACALAAAACAGAALSQDAIAPGGEAVASVTVPVDLRSADPADRRIGRPVYRGGISIVPSDERFGGLSAFRVSADGTHFVAVEDEGVWATGTRSPTMRTAISPEPAICASRGCWTPAARR